MTINPILDQPQSVDYSELPSGPFHRLANHELICWLDAHCNPHNIEWPWGNGVYARSIMMRVLDIQEGELTPLVTRFFAGHQEVIAGSEGVIITKRLCVPYKTNDDRALFWLLECQAEGDRLLRVEIDIDWGEPLTQRIVDGLLVAQRNPGPARGVYRQSNAESTRIFGNPHGRPDYVDIDDPAHTHLTYHVLVNGIVEVPFIFTVSDVGEQMAWSSFLSLREVEEIFDISSRNWTRRLHAGRLWTPDPAFNLAVEHARLEALRHLQRHRSGTAPSDRRVEHIPVLVDAWDALDPAQSRNLLAHLRRTAEATAGHLPGMLPAALSLLPAQATAGHAQELLAANGAYIHALAAHIRRHRAAEQFLSEHLNAVRLCTDALIQLRAQQPALLDEPAQRRELATCMLLSSNIAARAGVEADAARWESEWLYLTGLGDKLPADDIHSFDLSRWKEVTGWRCNQDRPHQFHSPWAGVALAGAVIWQGIGLSAADDIPVVEPGWLAKQWRWWALLGVTLTEERRLSLVWDGATLHSTRPLRSSLPVQVHKRIQLLHSDEFDFDPVFEMIGEQDVGALDSKIRFKPSFEAER